MPRDYFKREKCLDLHLICIYSLWVKMGKWSTSVLHVLHSVHQMEFERIALWDTVHSAVYV